ncbi:helix-turn-helix domain-containing protein [Sphaerimonospora mesophila]|uniref:helix-turn-helix domain-containing protein n=1 Tax=Sphaerimonospora mesophila TaxID=37483 RepID=UPI0006E22B2E
MDASVLPQAYQDILEVLADAGGPLRAGQIVAAVGLPAGAAKVEGMRSRLKRMTERGWLREQAPGCSRGPGRFTPRSPDRRLGG